jgi:hypothetical protein
VSHKENRFIIKISTQATVLLIISLIVLPRNETRQDSVLIMRLIGACVKVIAINKMRINISCFFVLIGFFCLIHTDYVHADLEQCPPDSHIITTSGQEVDIQKLWGFHIGARFSDGACRAETLEGLIWWRSGQLTSVAPENRNGWTPFKIAFGFSREVRDSYTQGRRRTGEKPPGTLRASQWKGQEIALDHYPGLTIRLKEGLTMTEASNFNGDFILDNWRGEGGTRKIVTCSTVVTNHKKPVASSLSSEELKVYKFENDYDWCELALPDFAMLSGAGRVLFSGDKLREAATALPKIYEYIQSATIKKDI